MGSGERCVHRPKTVNGGGGCPPVYASQILAVLSQEAVRIRLPSGEKAAEVTKSLCHSKDWMILPVCASQSLAVSSKEAVRIMLLSGEKVAEVTKSLCPSKDWMSCPVWASQSLAVLDYYYVGLKSLSTWGCT